MSVICFFNSTKAWGGGEKWHLESSLYMHKKGYNILVVAHRESELYKRLKETGIKLIGISVSNFSFINPLKIASTKKIFSKHQVGTIIMNLSRDVKLAGLSAKKSGVLKIIYRRGSAIPIKNSFLNRYYFKNIITHILANSEATKKTVTQNNTRLFSKDKIKVIYNGIDIDDFLSNPYSPLYQKQNNSEIILTNLGRLEKQKNQGFLIELGKELSKRNLDYKIIIGGDGRLKSELLQKIKSANLTEKIKLIGFVNNPKDLMCSGDIFILSSLWEGFGYVLIEAALSKKPVLGFNVSSNPEIVEKDKTGFLTKCNDVIQMADKVEFFINNPSEIKKMGSIAFERAKKLFDSKNTLKQIEDYLINE